MLVAATGEPPDWTAAATPGAQLEADLQLDSLEVATLAALLAEAYGGRADLPGYLAGLDVDQLIGLTVGDLAAWLERCLAGSGSPVGGDRPVGSGG